MPNSASESDEIATEMARLEAALDRIAERSEMVIARATAITTASAAPDSQAVVQRLDSLIDRLRGAAEGI
jgi:methyl-accepting chemotaxis protein